jgi:RNA polymerase sigma factor (sigma-70 family)
MDDLYLKLVLDGNTPKFSYFIDKYKNMAYSIAFRILGNREDAEEAVQDSFLKAFISLDKFRKDAKFSTWLYRIVVNTSLSKAKRRKPESLSIDSDYIDYENTEGIEDIFDGLTSSERSEYVNFALDRLNVEDRLLLTLYYLAENSLNEVAEITGIAKQNIKMKLYRARNKMYNVLHDCLKSEIGSILC